MGTLPVGVTLRTAEVAIASVRHRGQQDNSSTMADIEEKADTLLAPHSDIYVYVTTVITEYVCRSCD